MGNLINISRRFFVLIAVLFLISFKSFAQLSQPQIYRRCYMQLVQAPVPLKDTQFIQVKNGTKKAIDACIELLNLADFDSNGSIAQNNLDLNSPSYKILRTFFEFHKTWFVANTMEQIQDYNEEVNRGSNDLYDPQEPAYFLTRALFGVQRKFADILTGYDRLKAIRSENKKKLSLLGFNILNSYPSRRVYGDNPLIALNLISFHSLNSGFRGNGDERADSDFAIAPVVPTGTLIGIQNSVDSFNVKNFAFEPLGRDIAGNKTDNLNFNFDINHSFGGGILGVPSYILMNLGHGRGLKFNGSLKLPRRWMKESLSSFMCASFPTLRESDITSLVLPNSETPFRKSSSCVQCHATLDMSAGVGRNLITGSTDYAALSLGRNQHAKYPIIITDFKPIMPAEDQWIDTPDNNFHLRSPKGKLYTRSINGELISRNVDSLNDLGLAISQTQDFYSCAAKRYFEFLTGIRVPLYDRKDPRNSELNKTLTEQHLQDREFVEKLGVELQTTQSLKQLVISILKSKYYQAEEFR